MEIHESFAEAASYFPSPRVRAGPFQCLEHLRTAKEAVAPRHRVVERRDAGRVDQYAGLMAQAGADAELNPIASRPTEMSSRNRARGR
jgi:hypothetical protein